MGRKARSVEMKFLDGKKDAFRLGYFSPKRILYCPILLRGSSLEDFLQLREQSGATSVESSSVKKKELLLCCGVSGGCFIEKKKTLLFLVDEQGIVVMCSAQSFFPPVLSTFSVAISSTFPTRRRAPENRHRSLTDSTALCTELQETRSLPISVMRTMSKETS